MLAVKSKQPKLIELLLAVEGIQLDVQTKRGFSALMIAAWKGDDKTVEKLLVKGAKIELKDGGKRNAWGIAHDWHNESTLELLGKHGLTYTSYGTSRPPATTLPLLPSRAHSDSLTPSPLPPARRWHHGRRSARTKVAPRREVGLEEEACGERKARGGAARASARASSLIRLIVFCVICVYIIFIILHQFAIL